jgi:hypothetical protein
MSASLLRWAGASGFAALVLRVANVAFTAEGPRPDRPAAAEATRVMAHTTQLRAC